VLAYFFYFKHERAPALTDKDTILIADFVNTTGEFVLDGTLKTALAVQLEQSPFLNLFPDARVRETLGYMGRKPDERVTKEIAREICERQGSKPSWRERFQIWAATTSLAWKQSMLTHRRCDSPQQEEAESKEQVLRTLGKPRPGCERN
jgi:hypothetical protein